MASIQSLYSALSLSLKLSLSSIPRLLKLSIFPLYLSPSSIHQLKAALALVGLRTSQELRRRPQLAVLALVGLADAEAI